MTDSRAFEIPGPDLHEALERFGELLKRSDSKEADFQRLFAERPYILSRTLPMRLAPADIQPIARPGRSDPDFTIFPAGDVTAGYGVIELKRPGSRIITEPRKGVVLLSRDARTALEQGLVYAEQLPDPLAGLDNRLLMLGNQRHVFVIMGLTSELIEKVGHDIYQRQIARQLPDGCRLIPYDTLLRAFEASVPPQIMVLVPSIEASGLAQIVSMVEGALWRWSVYRHTGSARDFWSRVRYRVDAVGRGKKYPELPPGPSFGKLSSDLDACESFARATIQFLRVLSADAIAVGIRSELEGFLGAIDPSGWEPTSRRRQELSDGAFKMLGEAARHCEKTETSYAGFGYSRVIRELEEQSLVRFHRRYKGEDFHFVHPFARFTFRQSLEI